MKDVPYNPKLCLHLSRKYVFIQLCVPNSGLQLALTDTHCLLDVWKVCVESIHPCTMKSRNIYWRRYKKHWTQYNDTSVSFEVGPLGPHSSPSISSTVQNSQQTPLLASISCPIIFPWISSMVWNHVPFKGDFHFGKSQKSRYQIWAIGELSQVGDLMFHQKPLHETHKWACCHDEAAHSCSCSHRDPSLNWQTLS